jgi:uncharacterized Fe-S center protein
MKKNKYIYWQALAVLILLISFTLTCQAQGQKMNVSNHTNSASKVYFTKNITQKGLLKVAEPMDSLIHGKVAMKVHFGEEGNKNFIPADTLKLLAEKYKVTFVETNVLYGGKRGHTDSHIKLAKEHGFTYAPIDILDSEGEVEIPFQGKHYKAVYTGAHINNYDTIIVVSHFKGHMAAGFGGAIKNISMGMASYRGKLALHANSQPKYNPSKCIKCGTCVKGCPVKAITIDPLKIDKKKCVACGKCIQVCPVHAFSIPWENVSPSDFLERLVEYAKAITNGRNVVYINVLASISPDCDCFGKARPPFIHDIGILASTDIVALEQASLDMVNEQYGSKDAFLKEAGVAGDHQVEYAEELGMGTRKYQIVDIDK